MRATFLSVIGNRNYYLLVEGVDTASLCKKWVIKVWVFLNGFKILLYKYSLSHVLIFEDVVIERSFFATSVARNHSPGCKLQGSKLRIVETNGLMIQIQLFNLKRHMYVMQETGEVIGERTG